MRCERNAGGAVSPASAMRMPAMRIGKAPGNPAGAAWLPPFFIATGCVTRCAGRCTEPERPSAGYDFGGGAGGGGGGAGGFGGGHVTAPSFVTVAPRTTSSAKSTRKLRSLLVLP